MIGDLVMFTSGLYISCLGDNHNGWHKPSQSTEYRVQIYLDLSYHGGTMMALLVALATVGVFILRCL
jgi:hypothetical protein